MGFVLKGGATLCHGDESEKMETILPATILVTTSYDLKKKKVEQIRSRKTGGQPKTQTNKYAEACDLLYPFRMPSKLASLIVSTASTCHKMVEELNPSGEPGPRSSL